MTNVTIELRISNINVRSIRNKYLNTIQYVLDSESDITIITEHWMTKIDEIQHFELESYNIHKIQTFLVSRTKKNGGGALILTNRNTETKMIKKLITKIKYGVEVCAVLALKMQLNSL